VFFKFLIETRFNIFIASVNVRNNCFYGIADGQRNEVSRSARYKTVKRWTESRPDRQWYVYASSNREQPLKRK